MQDIPVSNETQMLEASLQMLGLRELEERLEISPLVVGDGPGDGRQADTVFQSCQQPLPVCNLITKDGGPVPTSTGPTNPGGMR
jgi:hypothetical protein